MCVSVTVLSMRTRWPVSTPAPCAARNRQRLTRSQVSARTVPTVACSADFFGTRIASTRAKRRTDRESRKVNSRPRQVSWRRCLSTAQRSTVSQLRPWRPPHEPLSAPRSAATASSSSGWASSHAEIASRASATGWSTGSGSKKLSCAVRFWRMAPPAFSIVRVLLGARVGSKTRITETPVSHHVARGARGTNDHLTSASANAMCSVVGQPPAPSTLAKPNGQACLVRRQSLVVLQRAKGLVDTSSSAQTEQRIMRIYFRSIERAKGCAKSLGASVNGLRLSAAQETVATLAGYRDWHDLAGNHDRELNGTQITVQDDNQSRRGATSLVLKLSKKLGLTFGDALYTLAQMRLPGIHIEDLEVHEAMWLQLFRET